MVVVVTSTIDRASSAATISTDEILRPVFVTTTISIESYNVFIME